MLKDILYIGAGGAIGSILRYLISLAIKNGSATFPWATLTVNIVGCLLIGLLYGITSRTPEINQQINLFLTVGLCGGFTTFSTFSKESIILLQSGNNILCAIYIIASVVIGIAAVAIGYWLMK